MHLRCTCIYAHAWRTLRSHDFDTITCVRRCERAVMFFVTSLRFGRGAPFGCTGACVRACVFAAHSPHRACARACVRTLRHARLCERVHVACACECTRRVRDFFFEAHSPLRSAARETTFGWGPLRSQKLIIFLFAIFGISSRARARPRNENDVHATKIAANGCRRSKILKFSKNDRFSFSM